MTHTATLEDFYLDFEIEYYISQGAPETRDEPATPESIGILSVSYKGEEVTNKRLKSDIGDWLNDHP